VLSAALQVADFTRDAHPGLRPGLQQAGPSGLSIEVGSPSEPEGRIARRGAVRAALKAQDFARAEALAERYLAEVDTANVVTSFFPIFAVNPEG
jgi:hypothetical protein